MSEINEETFDVRQLERFLQEGRLTPEQVANHLASLEDCSANTEKSSIVMISYERARRPHTDDEGGQEEDEG